MTKRGDPRAAVGPRSRGRQPFRLGPDGALYSPAGEGRIAIIGSPVRPEAATAEVLRRLRNGDYGVSWLLHHADLRAVREVVVPVAEGLETLEPNLIQVLSILGGARSAKSSE